MVPSSSNKVVKNASGRYDNVDFTKAVGHQFAPIKASYLRRDVLLFANSIGVTKDELHFLYELHPNFAAFPTFPINLAFKQTDQDVFDFIQRTVSGDIPGVPPFDPKRSVDGERGIEIVRPIPISSEGLDLEINGSVIGVYDKGGNMILEGQQLLRDARTDTVYARMTNTAFGIGQGGYGGPRGPTRPSYPPPERVPDAVHVFKTSPEQTLLYRLSGDYNPIHADDEFAKAGGFKRAFLQGLGTWNIAAHGMLKELGNSDPARFCTFKARFANIVYPGDALETRMWKVASKNGVDEIIFQTVVQSDGRVALSNGFATLKQEASAKSHL
ncbi:Thioesterase/thiol ester dehydrase-isomerase [Lepidopterella palustris CBS 459.81]|uniref:Thioesterase/thiol ester dehydrase-isomerase n=1 Tax=Lepidopterella palustris CBS 459.81 TaxID=1314670 RepID=A0A8E2E1E6_9PEZI|nr:Thioesterase/thiol ester dehydrase-isomerase [Lepidopterella palustris CBS 459.81]